MTLCAAFGAAFVMGGLLLPGSSTTGAPTTDVLENVAYEALSPQGAVFAEAEDLKAKKKLTDIVIEKVNAERKKAGCQPLGKAAALTKSAQDHSDDMSKRNYFSHTTPEGVTFDQRIRKAGYPRPGAENIAKGATTATQVMSLWMNSTGHRQNILNCDLTKIGVGLAKDGWYWTQNFGY